MIPEGRTVHRSPGRLRIRIPSRRRDASYFSGLTAKFADFSGVERVEANDRLGSVLFLHTTTVGAIIKYAKDEGLFDLKTQSPPARLTVFGGAVSGLRDWDRRLKSFTGGSLDIMSLVFLALILTGVYQLSKGPVRTPPWYTAFWYALGVFSKTAWQEWDEPSFGIEDVGDLGDLGDGD